MAYELVGGRRPPDHEGLPQLVTQTTSWNDTNRLPNHTFLWEGIDGSSLKVHFPPVDNYNSDLGPRQLTHAEKNVAQSDVASSSVSLGPSGWGDGGGGPTREHAETARRTADLQGIPKVKWGTPNQYFEEVDKVCERVAGGNSGMSKPWSRLAQTGESLLLLMLRLDATRSATLAPQGACSYAQTSRTVGTPGTSTPTRCAQAKCLRAPWPHRKITRSLW